MWVFPTCVGVFLSQRRRRLKEESLPHVRGGVSTGLSVHKAGTASSPRAWGCFLSDCRGKPCAVVFPTCVGVFPVLRPDAYLWPRLPHVRGGVSDREAAFRQTLRSSPRAWGCFRGRALLLHHGRVFPTCVGVFLPPCQARKSCASLPHVRGGVSSTRCACGAVAWSSPRAWGCFSLM